MRRIATTVATRMTAIAATLMLLLFTTAIHNVVQPMSAHAMNGMEHGDSTSIACVSLCSTAVIKRQGVIEYAQDEEQDDEHAPAYAAFIDVPALLKSLYPASAPPLEPPAKIPLYTLHVAFLS